jgi:hypothetical protein
MNCSLHLRLCVELVQAQKVFDQISNITNAMCSKPLPFFLTLAGGLLAANGGKRFVCALLPVTRVSPANSIVMMQRFSRPPRSRARLGVRYGAYSPKIDLFAYDAERQKPR